MSISRDAEISAGAPLIAAENSSTLLAASVRIRCLSALQLPEFFGSRSPISKVEANAEQGACNDAGSVEGDCGIKEVPGAAWVVVDDVDDGVDDDVEEVEEDPQPATTSTVANTRAMPTERQTEAVMRKVPMA